MRYDPGPMDVLNSTPLTALLLDMGKWLNWSRQNPPKVAQTESKLTCRVNNQRRGKQVVNTSQYCTMCGNVQYAS